MGCDRFFPRNALLRATVRCLPLRKWPQQEVRVTPDDRPTEESDVEVDGVMVPAVAFQFRWFVADVGLSHRLDPMCPSVALCGHPWEDPEWEGPWDPPFASPCLACDEARLVRVGHEGSRRRRKQRVDGSPPEAPARLPGASSSRRARDSCDVQFTEPPARKRGRSRTPSVDKRHEELNRRAELADTSRGHVEVGGSGKGARVVPPPMPKRTEISLASASGDEGRSVHVVPGGLPSLGRRR
jgi:hypothetical protein